MYGVQEKKVEDGTEKMKRVYLLNCLQADLHSAIVGMM